MRLIEYTTETQVYYTTGSIESNCNSILFLNTGTVDAIIDGVRLSIGQSLAIEGNENEINIKKYPIFFQDGGSPSDTGNLTIIRKIYLGSGAPSYANGRKPDPTNC